MEAQALELEGRVGMTGPLLHGWARDPADPDRALFVDVYVDQVLWLTARAGLWRADLASALGGSGRYAFTVPLSPELLVRPQVEIRVCHEGSDRDLIGSPLQGGDALLEGTPEFVVIEGIEEVLNAPPEAAAFDVLAPAETYGVTSLRLERAGDEARLSLVETEINEPAAGVLSLVGGQIYPSDAFGSGPGRMANSSFRIQPIGEYEMLRPGVENRRVLDGCLLAHPRSRARLDQPVVHLMRPGSYNFYHWMIDILPHLWRLEDSVAAGARVVINQASFRRPVALTEAQIALRLWTLDTLGYGPERRIVVDADFIEAPVVHVVGPFYGTALSAGRAVFDRLKSAALARGAPGAPPRRIYVSRNDATRRRLLNEAALIDRLAPLGFVPVELETLDLPAQITLFSQAEMVVAPHGAGLAHQAFMPPGGRVLELLPASIAERAYVFSRLAHVFGHRHAHVLAGDVRGGGLDAHFSVDLDLVDLGLERLAAET